MVRVAGVETAVFAKPSVTRATGRKRTTGTKTGRIIRCQKGNGSLPIDREAVERTTYTIVPLHCADGSVRRCWHRNVRLKQAEYGIVCLIHCVRDGALRCVATIEHTTSYPPPPPAHSRHHSRSRVSRARLPCTNPAYKHNTR